MKKLIENRKTILCYLGLILTFILVGNSNNIPDTFAERLFRPITMGNGMLHYSGLIVLVVFYLSLSKLNEIKERAILNTPFRRIVTIVILMAIIPSFWTSVIKFYKGFNKDLNSVFLDRNNTVIQFTTDGDSSVLKGTLSLSNPSNTTQWFKVKVKLPSSLQETVTEEYITLPKEYNIPKKSNIHLDLNEEFNLPKDTLNGSFTCNAFEYVLFNDTNDVIFKGYFIDYIVDKISP